MSLTTVPARGEVEELRIALALNGGVGLAVWIGGVANEVERLVSRRGSYDDLLRLTATEARVDVISGSSAGGINGAFLATAIVHATELAPLRGLWVDQGDLADLLRDPLERRAPSLMRGDDYFLPQLRRAFATLWNPNPATRRTPEEAPIVLTLTTTLLQGEPTTIPDDYGTVITDVDHKARFVFERESQCPPGADPFADREIIDQLAVAARSTASFPGAFESSYVPVDVATTSPYRPAMGAFLRPPITADRFVVDGGVLDNKPIEGAVADIFRQRAERPVRRVLAYVVPDPGYNPDAHRFLPAWSDAPSVAAVALASLVTLPRYQSIGEELRLIREHNREVADHRRARLSLVGLLEPETIVGVAEDLFPVYAALRRDRSIRSIVEEVSEALSAQTQSGLPFRGRREWLRSLFDAVDLPWVPSMPPRAASPGIDPDNWRWGTRAVEKVGATVLSMLRDMQQLAALVPPAPAELAALSNRAFDAVLDLARLRAADGEFWRTRASQLIETGILSEPSGAGLEQLGRDAGAWVRESLLGWAREPFVPGIPRLAALGPMTIRQAGGTLAADLAQTTVAAEPVVRAVLEATEPFAGSAGVERVREDLSRLAGFLVPGAGDHATPPTDHRTLCRLLSLHVAMAALDGNDVVEQDVELIQISGDTPSSVGGPDHAQGKLSGIQLGHFGAFYRRSWRANDWMQGRLDGARRLAQIVLSPARLRAIAWDAGSGTVGSVAAEAIAHVAWSGATDEKLKAALERRYDRAGVERELQFLDHPEVAVPEMLPLCVDAVARRFQLEVLLDELPQLYQAVVRDEATGTRAEGASSDFAHAFRAAGGSQSGLMDPEAALTLYRNLRIGEEKVTNDIGSDLFSSTVSQLLATTALVLNDHHLPLGFLKNALRAIRAPLLLAYLLVRSATSGRAGAAVNSALVAGGALIVGLSLLTSESLPGILVTAGWAGFSAALLLILLRSRLGILRTVIPVAAVAGLGAFMTWVAVQHGFRAFFNHQRGEAIAILLLVGVLVYVGSLRRPAASAHARAVKRIPRGVEVVAVEVDGRPWRRVQRVASAGADDQVFELSPKGKVRFGDGVHGSPPPPGAVITLRYREGSGVGGIA